MENKKKYFIIPGHENKYFLDIIKNNDGTKKIGNEYNKKTYEYIDFLKKNKIRNKKIENELTEYDDFFYELQKQIAKKAHCKKFFPQTTIKKPKIKELKS